MMPEALASNETVCAVVIDAKLGEMVMLTWEASDRDDPSLQPDIEKIAARKNREPLAHLLDLLTARLSLFGQPDGAGATRQWTLPASQSGRGRGRR